MVGLQSVGDSIWVCRWPTFKGFHSYSSSSIYTVTRHNPCSHPRWSVSFSWLAHSARIRFHFSCVTLNCTSTEHIEVFVERCDPLQEIHEHFCLEHGETKDQQIALSPVWATSNFIGGNTWSEYDWAEMLTGGVWFNARDFLNVFFK